MLGVGGPYRKGSGKSTLLEAMAIGSGFNPEGDTKNYSFSTYDSHSKLCSAMKISKGYRKAGWGYFLRVKSFYNSRYMSAQNRERSFSSLPIRHTAGTAGSREFNL